MWPFTRYPEVTASQVSGKAYDYIVVGGGTAGCCVAARLSEDPGVSVLVIEKGHVKDNMPSRIPLMSQNFWMGETLQAQSTRFTEPITNAYGRRNRIWTAEGIGGASRINGMLWSRGVPGGYNEWAEKFGLENWSWDKVEPYFRKIEDASAVHPTSTSRGQDGPYKLKQSPQQFAWPEYTKKAAEKLGLPVVRDGNDSTAPAMGLFNVDMCIDGSGRRVSSYTAFLNKKVALERRSHLTVCTGVIVSRLDVDANAGLVRRVYMRPTNGPFRGDVDICVEARREVILCAGAVCTPQILLLSGIGPEKQMQTHGIPQVKELPVGQTLQDHCIAAVMIELPKSETVSVLLSFKALWYILVWLFTGKGILGSNATPQTALVNTKHLDSNTLDVAPGEENENLVAARPANIPDIEIMVQGTNSFESHFKPDISLFSFLTSVLQPLSNGSIELASKNPLANPQITSPSFQDIRDLEPFRRGIRLSMRFAEEFQNSGYPHPAKLKFAPGVNLDLLNEWEKSGSSVIKQHSEQEKGEAVVQKTWKSVTDNEIDDYVRRVGMTSLHLSSSCPMRVDSSHGGVVDQRLRLHGVTNLRIADASVMPKILSCHLMAPIIMIAERCADFIKEDQP
ncbi:hypothetical protein GGR56DRAFT_660827 [Xylariaceae sp. FL0804]|nr:hypothetical protein GGR56DRAFT_660827 [Xylariaceae sp. FL0804]